MGVQCYIFAFYFTKKQPLKSALHHISTIIFDLGGVILDLDMPKSLGLFARYSGVGTDTIMKGFTRAAWPRAFEKGEIAAADFRAEVRKSLNAGLSDDQIDAAWNAMLGELPLARLELLAKLRPQYQLLVLSNTNAIHVAAFDKIVAKVTGGNKIDDYVDKVYYSHELGMRKPEAGIYQRVIRENSLQPEATLFIDDMKENITSAADLGLQTIHLTNQDDLFEIFS